MDLKGIITTTNILVDPDGSFLGFLIPLIRNTTGDGLLHIAFIYFSVTQNGPAVEVWSLLLYEISQLLDNLNLVFAFDGDPTLGS
jgi:hypothetical protein